MNCDFVETEYFYHQLGGQGENNSDPPSPSSSSSFPEPVLEPIPNSEPPPSPNPMPSHELEVGPTEEVNSTTEPSSDSHRQPEVHGDSPIQSSPSLNPEVNSSDSPVNMTNMRQEDEGGTGREEDEGTGSEGEISGEDEDRVLTKTQGSTSYHSGVHGAYLPNDILQNGQNGEADTLWHTLFKAS